MRFKKSLLILVFIVFSVGCQRRSESESNTDTALGNPSATATQDTTSAAKLTLTECVDPDLTQVPTSVSLTMCDGTLQNGTMSLSPWHLRFGVTVGDVSGKLKMNCRNMANVASHDNTATPGAMGLDYTDTIDDYNGDTKNFPTDNPWGDDKYICGGETLTANSIEANMELETVSGDPVLLDKMSLTYVSPSNGAKVTHNNAHAYCEGLSHAGITNWRLPTTRELLQLTIHGIMDFVEDSNWADMADDCHWSSTLFSSGNPPTFAWWTCPDSGSSGAENRSNASYYAICVADAPDSAL